jgi:hypothetical protein
MIVYKYPLPNPLGALQRTELTLPFGAKILSIQRQAGRYFLWALVDPSHSLVFRVVWSVGTGYPIDYPFSHIEAEHLATTHEPDTGYVWHWFAKPE